MSTKHTQRHLQCVQRGLFPFEFCSYLLLLWLRLGLQGSKLVAGLDLDELSALDKLLQESAEGLGEVLWEVVVGLHVLGDSLGARSGTILQGNQGGLDHLLIWWVGWARDFLCGWHVFVFFFSRKHFEKKKNVEKKKERKKKRGGWVTFANEARYATSVDARNAKSVRTRFPSLVFLPRLRVRRSSLVDNAFVSSEVSKPSTLSSLSLSLFSLSLGLSPLQDFKGKKSDRNCRWPSCSFSIYGRSPPFTGETGATSVDLNTIAFARNAQFKITFRVLKPFFLSSFFHFTHRKRRERVSSLLF